MEIPAAFGCLKIIKKVEELSDENVPKDMIEAVILFRRTNEMKALEMCQSNINKLFLTLSAEPDGKSQVKIGYGSVCWDCGFCGLPNIKEENSQMDDTQLSKLLPICAKCNSNNVNMIKGEQPDGSTFPWIEVSSTAPV